MPYGNRFTVKLVNSEITSKSQLPSGKIVTTVGKNNTNTYDKNAFESDGSLIFEANVYKGTNTVLKVKWKEGVETVYTFNFSNATFAEE